MRGSPGVLGRLFPRDKERLFSRALPRSVFGPTRVDAGNAANIMRFVMDDQPVASSDRNAAKASPASQVDQRLILQKKFLRRLLAFASRHLGPECHRALLVAGLAGLAGFLGFPRISLGFY